MGLHDCVSDLLHCMSEFFVSSVTQNCSSAQVCISLRIATKWRTSDWSSSGMLLIFEAVEEALGDRLRLNEYRQDFADDESAELPSEVSALRQ